jgi:hypothetical protein
MASPYLLPIIEETVVKHVNIGTNRDAQTSFRRDLTLIAANTPRTGSSTWAPAGGSPKTITIVVP